MRNTAAPPCLTRRSAIALLGATGAAALSAHAEPWLLASNGQAAMPSSAAAAPLTFQLSIDPTRTLATVPANFTGLSYESAQLTHAAFFSASNQGLIALFSTLGRHGVLRIGGNTSAYTTFVTGTAAPSTDAAGAGPDTGGLSTAVHPMQQPGMYRITPQAIDNLAAFLQQTGWQLIYGLNLRHGTPQAAAEEAAYVAKACEASLLALQFGNEPDLFRHDEGSATQVEADKRPLWGYDLFLQKWQAMYAAVHARLPQVPIAGPDSAYKKEWGARFAVDTKGDISLLTTHYYAEGPPTDPRMTIDYLLHPGEGLQTSVFAPLEAAKIAGLPFRMTEGNSCYQGGKPGVSNTQAAALWAGDLMLSLAARGAAGVNLHGGGQGYYTPIITAKDGTNSASPDFYGMWLAGMFANCSIVSSQLVAAGSAGNAALHPDTQGDTQVAAANVTAYVANTPGASSSDGGMGTRSALLIAIFNKGPHPVTIDLDLHFSNAAAMGTPTSPRFGRVYVLAAPSPDSTIGITFGRGPFTPGTVWHPASNATLEAPKPPAKPNISLFPYSAVLLRME